MNYYNKSNKKTDAYGKHHWTWFVNNGKSSEENFNTQREEIRNWCLAKKEERGAAQSGNSDDDIVDVKFNIKAEVKK